MLGSPDYNTDLAALASHLWTWRAATQPSSGDDIPRVERPPDWAPDWSPDAVTQRAQQLAAFRTEWSRLAADARRWPVALQVDYRLLGSLLSRVHWELDVVQGWRRNPQFYVYQSLGAMFEALLPPPPFDAARGAALLRRTEQIPATLDAARANLSGHAIQPFAQLALASIDGIGSRLTTVSDELTPLLDTSIAEQLRGALARAGSALEAFGEWLTAHLATMPTDTAIGRNAYSAFLRDVALIPMSPEQIAAAGQQELERAVAFEALEQLRNRKLPPLPLAATQAEQIARQAEGEAMLRQFCEEHDVLSFPSWLGRYRNLPMPSYLAPLRGLGVTDDLRPGSDGIAYIPRPSPDLPYFYLAMARDPRTLIAHEGVHYYQLARSWAHPNPIRRHYYDSGPNEGIGFYAEEMLLQAGLFDDSPRSREIIYNFMRLRALRVSIDVRLALGELTIHTGAEELARRVPMDVGTAREEASFFASEPGQAITYQIGKLQILRFLADARLQRGDTFDVRAFHDSLWLDGNVPIALQRWQALGLRDEIDALDTASERLST
jgi:uncharacterized protein (DUF885 family)